MNARTDTLSWEDCCSDRVAELHEEIMEHHDLGDALADLGDAWTMKLSEAIREADSSNNTQRQIRMARLGSLVHECMTTYAKAEAEKMFNAEVKKQTEQEPD